MILLIGLDGLGGVREIVIVPTLADVRDETHYRVDSCSCATDSCRGVACTCASYVPCFGLIKSK